MKALKGSPEEKALLQRYTHQLDSQEDRLDVLKKEIPQIQAKRSQAEEELDLKIQQITLDQNF
jgi:uncharacterized protein (DUF342 family)